MLGRVREVGRGEEAEEGRRGKVDEGEDVERVAVKGIEEGLGGEEVRQVGGRVEDREELRGMMCVRERTGRERARERTWFQ